MCLDLGVEVGGESKRQQQLHATVSFPVIPMKHHSRIVETTTHSLTDHDTPPRSTSGPYHNPTKSPTDSDPIQSKKSGGRGGEAARAGHATPRFMHDFTFSQPKFEPTFCYMLLSVL